MANTESQEISRDTVFVVGGQPSVTYVDRVHLKIEESLTQAMDVPNQIASLAGPSKSGKTVLCRKILGERPYIWVEGGQVETSTQVWDKICYILNYPMEIGKAAKDEQKGGFKFGFGDWLSIDGSLLKGAETKRLL